MAREKPRKLAVIDAETDPFERGRLPKPFIWGFYDGEQQLYFDTTADLIEFLAPQRLLVYAHNGGKFDYHLPGFLDSLEAGENITIISGRLARFNVGDCEFRDSWNILPIQLAAYKKDEISYDLFEAGRREQHMDEIRAYLGGDCRYLYEIVSQFHSEYGRGLTLASSAMKYWQDNFHKDPPCTTQAFYESFKPFYYGGRVECFRTGPIETPFIMADINSAYPHAMFAEHAFSESWYAKTLDQPVGGGVEYDVHDQDFYVCVGQSRGAFPFRDDDGSLRFPADGETRSYNVTGWELRAALETDTFTGRIEERRHFVKTQNFRRYVEHFYDMKQSADSNGDTAAYLFAKLMMNSLYGKFGANPDNYAEYTTIDKCSVVAAEECGDGVFAGELGNVAVLKNPLPEHKKRYFHLACAASITGYVRAYMWRSICAIRDQGGEPLYCDTDSIAYVGSDTILPVSTRLGDWAIEGHFIGGGIAGKKLYAFESQDGKWKTGCKGARLGSDDIMRIARGETVTWENNAPTYSVGKAPRFLSRELKMT